MPLTNITISGADDSVDPGDLINLSKEFPYVEWGILMSRKRQGKEPRYPSYQWISKLWKQDLRLSAHLCGSLAEDFMNGEGDWPAFFEGNYDRVQINGFSEKGLTTKPVEIFRLLPEIEFIMQSRTEHDLKLARFLARSFRNVSALHDMSAGKGVSPESWPEPDHRIKTGYAGGLGPSNIVQSIEEIQEMYSQSNIVGWRKSKYWMDMESKVRSNQDKQFDLTLVREVLETARPYIAST